MRSIFRINPRLKPSILTAFAFLTIPVFFTIIAVNYFSNDNIARADAKELVERFRIDALENIEDDFNPLKSLIRTAATIGEQYPGFYSDNRCLAYFYSILQSQQEDRRRLCRPERRRLSADEARRPGGDDPGQAAAGGLALRLSLDRAERGIADPRSLCLPR